MDDATIHERIEKLVNEEHELWQREAAGDADDATRQRLAEVKVSLDQTWDLLRQREALRSRPHGSRRRGRARPERRRELPPVGPQPVILDNGVIRTLDPSLPTCGALAIAGPIVAGGVGTHEWMLPTPERVDLAGRCVLPAFTDSHVHFPTWSLARHDVRLEEADSVAAALALVAGHARRGTWIRGTGWRDAAWPRAADGAPALDAVTGDTPAALWSKDYHSLWLNSAGLARAGGNLDEPGGVVERDADGSPTGILREESAWRFRDRYVTVTEDEWVDATREGIRVANANGVGAIHDKDGWLGAASIFGRIHEQEGLSLRVWQSLPVDRLPGDRRAAAARADRRRLPAPRLREDVHGRHARLADGADARRLRRADHEPGGARGDHPRLRPPPAGPSRCTRSATGRTATRSMPSRRRRTTGSRSASGTGSSTRSASIPRTSRGSPSSGSPARCSSPTPRPTVISQSASGATGSKAPTRSGACSTRARCVVNGSDAPVEELDPLAGIRAGVLRTIDDRPAWQPDQALTIEQAIVASTVTPAWLAGDERRRGRLLPGLLADLVVLSRDPFTCPPDELESVEVVSTMVGGKWVYQPPPWD